MLRSSEAEEVALTFDNEGVYIAHYLKGKKYINEGVYNLVIQIDEQLELLSNEHNEKNWTIQAMSTDRRWIKARALANEAYLNMYCFPTGYTQGFRLVGKLIEEKGFVIKLHY